MEPQPNDIYIPINIKIHEIRRKLKLKNTPFLMKIFITAKINNNEVIIPDWVLKHYGLIRYNKIYGVTEYHKNIVDKLKIAVIRNVGNRVKARFSIAYILNIKYEVLKKMNANEGLKAYEQLINHHILWKNALTPHKQSEALNKLGVKTKEELDYLIRTKRLCINA